MNSSSISIDWEQYRRVRDGDRNVKGAGERESEFTGAAR